MSAPRRSGRISAKFANEPWLGLLSYTSEHQEIFFGRGKETEVLLRMIRREPLTTVFGASGTGKSSLLNAAIAPRLAKEDLLPIYIRLDHNPGSPDADKQIRARIDKEVQRRGLDPSPFAPAAGDESVWEYLHRVELWNAENNPVTPVLLFDQFEEAFTLGAGRPETAAFFAALADLVENYTPAAVRHRLAASGTGLPYPQVRRYKIVLSLREDFVHKLDGLRKLMPSIMQNRFALTRMTSSQAMEAVLLPADGLVTEDVAHEIVTFVAGAPSAADSDVEVEPALLSVVCRELNFRRIQQGTPVITSEQVALSSADVLKDFYERSFDGIPDAARYFIEDRLLTDSGFRSTAPEEDAIKAGLPANVIRALEDRRIIRREQRLRIAHIELTHDLLTRVVRESRDARHERVRKEQERLEHEEREAQLVREKEEQEAKLKASRRLIAVMAAAAVICVVLAAVAVTFLLAARQSAEGWKAATAKAARLQRDATQLQQATQKALVRYYDERAHTAYRDNDDLLALVYTLEALADAPKGAPLHVAAGRLLLPELHPRQARYHQSFFASVGQPYLSFIPNGAIPHTAAAVSPDGRTEADLAEKAVVLKKNSKVVCTIGPELKDKSKNEHYAIDGAAFGPTGELLATFGDASIRFWSSESCQPVGTRYVSRQPMRIRQIAFSPDGTLLAAAVGTTILFLNVPEHPEAPIPEITTEKREVSAVAFNMPGGAGVPNILAAGYDDGGVCWWNLASEMKKPTCGIGSQDRTRSVSIAPDRSMVLSGHHDKAVRIWDFASGRLLAEIPTAEPVKSVAFSTNGKAFGYLTAAEGRSLPFNDTMWKSPVDFAAYISNPWSPRNRAALNEWRTESQRNLGYEFTATNLVTTGPNAFAEATLKWFRPTGLPFEEKTVLIRENAQAKAKKYPRWGKGGELLLVPDETEGAAAAALLEADLEPPFDVEFEFSIRNKGGAYGDADWKSRPADGFSVIFLKNLADYDDRSPEGGGRRGTVPGSGYAIHFHLFEYPRLYLEKIRLEAADEPHILKEVPRESMYELPELYTDGVWRKARISVRNDSVTVEYAGVVVLQWQGKLNTEHRKFGFSAANGEAHADHRIRNVKITIPQHRR